MDSYDLGLRSYRRRRAPINPTVWTEFDPPYQAATEKEKADWEGFTEIESDPTCFNLMLREFGVRGVKVQEVFSLDYLLMEGLLPQPVYGLIFLFMYQVEDTGEEVVEQCPDYVWFANQVMNNSCASVALLNSVCNIPGIKLGEELEKFKAETMGLHPAIRGQKLANLDHIRKVHNSFARVIDMANTDMLEQDEFKNRNKNSKQKGGRSRKKQIDAHAAFHFVTYLPIKDEIWRLDGLHPQPQKMGPCDTESWLAIAGAILAEKMVDSGINYNLLALVQDPLTIAQDKLAYNIVLNQTIEKRLDQVMPQWKESTQSLDNSYISGPNGQYHINKDILEEVTLDPKDLEKLNLDDDGLQKFTPNDEGSQKPKTGQESLEQSNTVYETSREQRHDLKNSTLQRQQQQQAHEIKHLQQLRMDNASRQQELRNNVLKELASQQESDDKAEEGRNDYGPVVQRWLMMLAENGVLRELHEECS